MESQKKKKSRVVVIISGRGSNLRALYDYSQLKRAAFEVIAVVSDKKKAAGLEFASSCSIPTAHVPRLAKERSAEEFNTALAETVSAFQPDLVVLAGFMRILRPEFIEKFPNQIINIHPSLLPSFPGLDVQQQALDAGVRFSGCSVHLVTAEVDAGTIIGQAVVPIKPGDDADSLAARILEKEHQLFPAVVQGLSNGDIKVEQTSAGVKLKFAQEILPETEESSLLSLRT